MPRVILLEGIPAAGKTTEAERLRGQFERLGLRVTVVPEPVDKWRPILRRFYAEPRRFAWHLETYALCCRVEAYRAACSSPGVDVIICDRSPWSSLCFAPVTLEPRQAVMFVKFARAQLARLVPPDEIRLLDIPAAEALARIKNRGRHEELAISTEYLEALRRQHFRAFARAKICAVGITPAPARCQQKQVCE